MGNSDPDLKLGFEAKTEQTRCQTLLKFGGFATMFPDTQAEQQIRPWEDTERKLLEAMTYLPK
jgi:hypothetical protein